MRNDLRECVELRFERANFLRLLVDRLRLRGDLRLRLLKTRLPVDVLSVSSHTRRGCGRGRTNR